MKNLKADIIIAAAGTAGLAAAVTAAESGASVIVLEKSGGTGGAANMAAGLFAVESRIQTINQITLTREEAFKKHMDFTQWRVNATLVKTYYEKSAGTIDWLEGLGVKFIGLCSHHPGFNYTMHMIGGKPANSPNYNMGSGVIMMKKLACRAKELGVNILLKTPVKQLIMTNRRINGVIGQDSSGEEITVTGGAVILATGGYGGEFPNLAGVAGDGIRMAKEAGAYVKDVRGIEKMESTSKRPSMTVMHSFQQPDLAVNLLGERFMNEEIMENTPFAVNAIAGQKDRTAFIIFDEATKNLFVEKGMYFAPHGPLIPVTKAEGFDADFQRSLEEGSDSLFVADSIKELAAKTGINARAFLKTVQEYNHFCETGRDEMFYKPTRYLRPVKQPGFYASKSIGNVQHGWEGIRINHKTEVLTPDYAVIPGLYAAGMDAAFNVFYDTYPSILPGNTMGFSINSGRMAAESACEYVEKK
jgi:fumarate reductase flavoprotein subunit